MDRPDERPFAFDVLAEIADIPDSDLWDFLRSHFDISSRRLGNRMVHEIGKADVKDLYIKIETVGMGAQTKHTIRVRLNGILDQIAYMRVWVVP